MSATSTSTHPALAPLEWECNHFGFSVAQLNAQDGSPQELETALRAARDRGFRLVVWPAAADAIMPEKLLQTFNGCLVDRKATFSRPIQHTEMSTKPARSDEFPVVPYAERVVSAPLADLALAAGVYSRFNVDPHFPKRKFEEMYHIWIERSVRGELADVVLVVPLPAEAGSSEDLGGMVTISQTDAVATIGLIAVASKMRGRGIGSRLLHSAHQWMLERGTTWARVVTQFDNVPACRLYGQAGYQVERIQPIYHFWL